jgi:phage terminase large subunit-like protein
MGRLRQDEVDALQALLAEQARRRTDANYAADLENRQQLARTKLYQAYPETGPLRRELYGKHLQHFAASAIFGQIAIMGGNRSGKTFGNCYQIACHMTGWYPSWWHGRRFSRPVTVWAAGEDGKSVRDSLQETYLGPVGSFGTGLIPYDKLERYATRSGIADAIDSFTVKHINGGLSRLVFKSYDQKREAFQAAKVDIIQLDEEPPIAIYTEALTRTLSTNPSEPNGLVIAGFTPLKGLSAVVLSFLPGGDRKEGEVTGPEGNLKTDKYVTFCAWEDAPHLSDDSKAKLIASYQPHERDARTKGVPALGSGAIYPIPEEEIICDPIQIPNWWPRAYGMDVGWNRTAVIWGAMDPEADILYLIDEHYRGQAEPAIHAAAIKARGLWINGVIDPAAHGRSQRDGESLAGIYKELGLTNLIAADNKVTGPEGGIYEVWMRLSTGRLRVFKTLQNWRAEYRIYRRDEKGKIVKENDHLLDATRYLCMSGVKRASLPPHDKRYPQTAAVQRSDYDPFDAFRREITPRQQRFPGDMS